MAGLCRRFERCADLRGWTRSPLHPELMAIKRIVALEGDTVLTRTPCLFPRTKVPFGHVWVEGEHPEFARNTLDSNTYGPVRSQLS